MRRRWRQVAGLLLVAIGTWSAVAQTLQGQVESAGFPAPAGPVLRGGRWLPIVVNLSVSGGIFSGELRAEAFDLDGDRVVYTNSPIALSSDAGGSKRLWLYAVVNAEDEMPAGVDVVDDRGRLAATLPVPPPVGALRSGDLLVLDVSTPPIGALRALETPAWLPGQYSEGFRTYYRNVVVARQPAEWLPDRWWGLDAVDVLVWDQPDLRGLSAGQRQALRQWVQHGGQLVVGLGANWELLRASDLGPLLPLQGAAETVEVQRLDVFSRNFRSPLWEGRELERPIVVTTAAATPDALRVLGDFGPGGPLNLVTLRLIGSGRVTATAAGLRDLLAQIGDAEPFLTTLIDLNRYTETYRKKLAEGAPYRRFEPQPIYDAVVAPVGFRSETALRGLTALLFVLAYLAVATVGSWWWLVRHRRTHLSWVVFAGVAAAAGALSLGTVSVMRGCSRGVQSLSVLDLESGASAARGVCLFGYRSPIRQQVRLTLPGDGNTLTPLARGPDNDSRYATAARYASFPTRAALDDVLMRATLKQLAGHWQGELDGTIRGDLVVSRADGRLTPGSWIANDFTTELAGGFLLFIDPRLDQAGVPCRVAGLTARYRRGAPGSSSEKDAVPAAMNVLAIRIPAVPAGGQVRELGRAVYEQLDKDLRAWRGRARDPSDADRPDLPTLWHEQQTWAGMNRLPGLRRGPQDPAWAVCLASTRNLHLPTAGTQLDAPEATVSTDGLPELDITHWLVRGQAVLLTWAESPGPPTLHRGGRPLPASAGLTIYRVQLPIRYQGSPPPPEVGP